MVPFFKQDEHQGCRFSVYDRGVAVGSCANMILDVQWLRSKDRHAVTFIAVSNLRSPKNTLGGYFFVQRGDGGQQMSGELVEIALKHKNLLDRILAKSTGAIGEILVADKLTEQGCRVEPTNNNAEQCDLVAYLPDGRRLEIEVKTSKDKRPTWFVRKCPDPKFSKIWCLVSAPRKPAELPVLSDVEIYVLTTDEAAQIWRSSDWNKKNPHNGDIRRHQIPDAALNAWEKLFVKQGVRGTR